MELRQLRYFVAIAEERHFGRAATRLRIATPSLSQQIRALERDLHVVLLHRDSHGVELTPAGGALLHHARALLTRAQRARDDVRCAATRTEPLSIRVATGAEDAIGELLPEVYARAPHLRVSIAPTLGTDAVHAVRDERADAAVVWADPGTAAGDDLHLARIAVGQVPVRLALPPAHRLAAYDRIPVGELAGETIVLYPRHLAPGPWDRIVAYLLPRAAARVGRLVIEADRLGGPAALPSAVGDGRGLAPVVGGSAAPGVVVRPLDPALVLPLELVWREPAGPALQQLVALLTGPDQAAVTGA